jgi:hypothetical protein
MTLYEQIRKQAGKLFRVRSVDADGISEGQYLQQVQEAQSLLAMMQLDGWKIYEKAAADLAEKRKEAWLSITPDKLTTAEAIQAQGIAIGARLALNEAATILNRGQRAESKLAEMKGKRNGDRATTTRIQ